VTSVLLQVDYEVADLYQVFETPVGVLVRPDGTIGSPLASGPAQVRSLVEHVLATPAAPWAGLTSLPMANGQIHARGHQHHHDHAAVGPSSPAIGEPAPPFIAPDLDGKVVALDDLQGQTTMLLFWSPACPFCRQLVPALHAWEAARPPDAPALLIVSNGSVEENRALLLQAPTLLDPQFEIGSAYGATGTPSGILVDGAGRIGSELAIGGAAILALVNADSARPSSTSAT
jgi:peroxiredoxin